MMNWEVFRPKKLNVLISSVIGFFYLLFSLFITGINCKALLSCPEGKYKTLHFFGFELFGFCGQTCSLTSSILSGIVWVVLNLVVLALIYVVVSFLINFFKKRL